MGQKKIRMKTLQAGPQGVVLPGTELLIDEKAAQALVEAQHAEYVEAEVKAAPAKEPEAAVMEATETAVAAKAKPRRRKK